MSDKLKPCPCCGGEARIVREVGGIIFHIECKICCCKSPSARIENARKAWNTRAVDVGRIEEIILENHRCINSDCDNHGNIPVKVSEREYVTHDMALDACDPSLEGSLCSDEKWEAEQCQYCYEIRFPNAKKLAQRIADELGGEVKL